MYGLTENPVFVRHLRAEMRAPRMFLAGGLALVICMLIALTHSQWLENQFPGATKLTTAQTLYFWIFCPLALILPLWCFSSCLQSVANERQMKTYDFVRTTRMNALELMIGYVFGAPVMAYYTIGITVLVAFISGIGAHVPVGAMLLTLLMLALITMFTSLVGLLISLFVEKPRAAGLLLVFLLVWPLMSIAFAAADSPFPGISALAIVPGLLPFYGVTDLPAPTQQAEFFGVALPAVVLSLLLYASLGVWVVLAILNNIKKERDEIRVFTNRQAIGFAIYVNLMMVGFFHPSPRYVSRNLLEEAFFVLLALNSMLFYLIGTFTLTPQERLLSWFRQRQLGRQSYFSDDGLAWPWVGLAGLIGYAAFLCIWMVARDHGGQITLPVGAVSFLIMIVFAARDVLFLQWCMLTKMKHPVSRGVALLLLYYVAAVVIGTMLSQPSAFHPGLAPMLSMLTPAGAFDVESKDMVRFIGLGLQALLSGCLLFLIHDRLAAGMKLDFRDTPPSAFRAGA